MARSIECECTNNFTCGYCLRNAKPYLFTPSKTTEMSAQTFEFRRGPVDGYWYYAAVTGNAAPSVDDWTGPFMTRGNAVRHSRGLPESPSNHD